MTGVLRRDREDEFARRLRAGEPATAVWVTMSWPHTAEMLGAAGVHAALIDLQHVSYGLQEAQAMILAAEVAGVSPLVRPTGVHREEVSRILDAGASGVVFPEIEDAGQAQAAVRTMRYPPRGVRGWGGAHTRYSGWQGGSAHNEVIGAHTTGGPAVHNVQFLARAESALCLIIVESVRGVENIDEIVAVEGLDGVIFGWGDYSVEAGFDVAVCDAAAARVYDACRGRGLGVAVPYSAKGRQSWFPGCFSIVGVDTMMFGAGIWSAVDKAREHWI